MNAWKPIIKKCTSKMILVSCTISGAVMIGLTTGLGVGLTQSNGSTKIATVSGFGQITLKNDKQITLRNEVDFNLLCDVNSSGTEIVINNTKFMKDTLTGFAFGSDFNLNAIGNNFLYNCVAFNQTITIPGSVQRIGAYFLGDCNAFNQTLTIPATVKEISGFPLYLCRDFDSAVNCLGNTSKPAGWSDVNVFTGTKLIAGWGSSQVHWN